MIDVRERRALVVGSGPELAPRALRLLDEGARVTLITEGDLPGDLAAREADGSLVVARRAPSIDDLDDQALTFITTPSTPREQDAAERLHAEAVRRGLLVCVIDRPELSTFINAAVARAGDVTIAVSTSGKAPALARRIREDLEALFDTPRFARFVEEIAAQREALPRGERAARAIDLVRGFAIDATLRFPTGEGAEKGS